MIRAIQITVSECICDVCGYRWLSYTSANPAHFCPNKKCRSRQWNGAKRVNKSQEIKLPAPRKAGRPKSIALLSEEP